MTRTESPRDQIAYHAEVGAFVSAVTKEGERHVAMFTPPQIKRMVEDEPEKPVDLLLVEATLRMRESQ